MLSKKNSFESYTMTSAQLHHLVDSNAAEKETRYYQ